MNEGQRRHRDHLQQRVRSAAQAVENAAAIKAENLNDNGSFGWWLRTLRELARFDMANGIEPSGT
jgi:hypothetical protein